MPGKHVDEGQRPKTTQVIPPSPYTEVPKPYTPTENVRNEDEVDHDTTNQKRNPLKAFVNFIYDSKKKKVLGRSSLNWAKLAAFYTVFYFCLGCFFVILLYVFALILDRDIPTYYNTESAMAVRTTASVVGMGFRPQPHVDDSLILITNDPEKRQKYVSSLKLYRDVFLTLKPFARVYECTKDDTAAELEKGAACAFDWSYIVTSDDHPCSEKNMFGFMNHEPCILVKLNKVYGWVPEPGPVPDNIVELGVTQTNDTSKPDVYITCGGSHPSDIDAIPEMIYYSLGNPAGSSKFGVIPYHFFPYRNAPDHIQPFVLVQFKNLPEDQLISVTCRAWTPYMEHDQRGMRGMGQFQLYNTGKKGVEDIINE